MGEDLFLELWYNSNTDMYGVDSNIKEGKRKDIVSEFLRGQVGAGEDNRKANVRDIYSIK